MRANPETIPSVQTERTAPSAPWWSWRTGGLILAGWTLVGIMGLSYAWTSSQLSGRAPVTLRTVGNSLESVWLWALMTPLIFACCERFPVVRPRWARHLGCHLVLCVALWAVEMGLAWLLQPWIGHPNRPFLLTMAEGALLSIYSYGGMAAIGHALRFYRLYMERRVRTSELETQLVRAQFLALQMQLRPHFLFNALNAITGLIRTGDSKGAVQMTVGLADLLRAVLRGDDSQEVPLHQELDFVARYLRIEQLRFQERLHTEIHVDPSASDALVPHLLLQPLVENAVRHGARAEAQNRVDIHITRESDMLWLRVRDTGLGPNPPGSIAPEPGVPREGGIGLTNTRARLRHLYGDGHRLELLHAEGGGAVAEVAIPYRRAARAVQ
ncbi:histidine kinase [Stigmatella sp. ncwal1]|uniref:Histidine kinase n=1 Tax=Stigmatella ashevillensis TaxID=2995309 RepID=A0ABT5DH04_9BACT|nr:histidine kinase [Stigmatella ashevillena]MDC0711646.1 histidine kinase [Stigmatella ashevillena]